MIFTYLRHLLIISAVALISACASLPPELDTKSESVIQDYQSWLNAPADSTSEVRLGGVIAHVTNLKDKTRIELVYVPIDNAGRPNIKTEPQGRFVGYVDEFLDPVTYAEGRLITLLGNTAPSEIGRVGEFEHQYPVMNIKGYHLWRVEERIIIHDFGSHIYPCRSYFCSRSDDIYSEGRVIQEVK